MRVDSGFRRSDDPSAETDPVSRYPHPLIAREGWFYVGLSLAVAAVVHAFAGFWWALPFWLVALFVALVPRSQWLAASVVAVAVLALQTDVIGIHWLSVVVFALAGAALRAGPNEPPPEDVL